MTPGNSTDPTTDVTLDELFEVLSRATRRRLLETPRHRDRLAMDEYSALAPGTRLSHEAVLLHHVHIPMMDDLGFVDWDAEGATVAPGPKYHDLRPVLALFDEHADVLPEGWP